MTTKCDSCGAPVENGKCTYCGKSFLQDTNANHRAPEHDTVEVKIKPKKTNNKKMTTCKTCQAQIAKSAKKCPYCGAKIKKPLYKKWWFWLILILLFAGAGSSGSEDESSVPENETTINQEVVETETKDTATPKEEIKDSPKEETVVEDSVPSEYKSALKKAEAYSEMMHMSKAGIYDQLTSEYGEQFTADAAQYAMDNLNADYKENALAKAKDYSDTMHMSKAGIYDQLTSEHGEQFTAEEAQYAVDNLVADYKANALAKAKDYQEMMNMSPAAIRDQLVSEYGEQFTAEEADYAIANLG